MNSSQKVILVIARLLISIVFLISAFDKIIDFEGTLHYMANHGMLKREFFLISAIIIQIMGGLSLFFGYHSRYGAMLLVVFLIPTTLIFHTDFSRQGEMVMFMKNLAVIGGLLMIVAFDLSHQLTEEELVADDKLLDQANEAPNDQLVEVDEL